MKSVKITSALMALTLGLSSTLALAQPRDDRDQRDQRQSAQQAPQRAEPGKGQPQPQAQQAQRAPQANKPQPAPQRQQDAGRGAGPQHSYHRGDRLPPEQRTRHAVVDNWRAYHLSAPPRGHQWVQVGSDFVLIAVATGIITQLVLSNR